MNQTEPKPLQWTPDLVVQFWNGMAKAGLDSCSFGPMAKRCIHWLIGRHLVSGGRHLDYGSGGGEVASHLIANGYPFSVYEPAVERQRMAEQRLAGVAGFLGSPAPEGSGTYDAVTCFEVLEHVLEQDFEGVCDVLAGHVRPGGKLVISTPNNENLQSDMVYCPVSNHFFHRWQHVRVVTPKFLDETFSHRGFKKICIHQLDFQEALFSNDLDLLGFETPNISAATPSQSAPPPSARARIAEMIAPKAPSPQRIIPLHIHNIIHNIDCVMGGATRILYIGQKHPA